MCPDHFRSWSGCTPGHVQIFVGLFKNDQGVAKPGNVPIFDGEFFPVEKR